MKNFKFELGIEAVDVITGFQGTVVGRCEHLTGCNTYGIQRKWKADDKEIAAANWFDENRIKKVGEKIAMPAAAQDNGGPSDNPMVK